jgi:phosphoserine phosphatase RsbU/P
MPAIRLQQPTIYNLALCTTLTGADAGAIVALTNRCLVNDLPTGQFVTLFLARLDPGTRSLVYCNAGHPSGYVLDQHGEVRLVLQSTDIPLGLDLTTEFPAAPVITLLPGDLLLLFTDGVTETFSPGDSLFGIERTLDVVRAHRHKSPAEIVQALFGAFADFSGNHAPLDDITAVIIKVEASN